MPFVIGIDIGTQSTKALMLDAAGAVVASHAAPYAPDTPRPLWAEQEASVWLAAVATCIRGCVEQAGAGSGAVDGGFDPGEVAAVCVSSLYGGSGIPVDDDLQPLHPCLIWMDRRASAQSEALAERVDLDRLRAVTGNGTDSYYGFTKMLWLRDERPDVWAGARHLLPPNAYVIAELTGEVAVDHASAGNIGGVYDIAARTWSGEMLEALGIDARLLPERLVECSAVVGALKPDWAARLGLRAGTPVVAGGVDAAVATYAAGVTRPGQHVAMMGTSMCWGLLSREADARSGLVAMPNVVNGLRDLYVFGGAITAGASASWFQQILSAPGAGPTSFAELDREAAHVAPGCEGLVFLPYLMGERSPIWDGRASGAFVGLNLTHTRAHMFRAVLEGVAYALRHNMEAASGAVEALDPTLTVVGGAARSDLWMRIVADVTGYPVRTLVGDVEAALGAGRLAALGVGLATDDGGASWGRLVDRAAPEPRAAYDTGFEVYRSLYPVLRDAMHRLRS